MSKRIHLRAVACGLAMFRDVEDMTSARFDFLYVLQKHGGSLVEIRKRLGLARQTVWKTMQRLVQLGIIDKTKRRRFVYISFTEEGRRRMHHALRVAFDDVPAPPECANEAEPGGEPNAARNAKRGAWRRTRTTGILARLLAPSFNNATSVSPMPAGRAASFVLERDGREVGRIFSKFAWGRLSGSRKKKQRYISEMENLLSLTRTLAHALGNYTPSIYRFDNREMRNPYLLVVGVETRVHRGGRVEHKYKTVRVD